MENYHIDLGDGNRVESSKVRSCSFEVPIEPVHRAPTSCKEIKHVVTVLSIVISRNGCSMMSLRPLDLK
ncbi:hypothetical protein PILCRDRAFT_825589, partial [Piloderma croceum F 1598]